MSKEEPKRILVVEQSELTTKVLKHLLTLWGYEFQLAGEGLAALEMVRRLTPDLLLVSFELSGFPTSNLLYQIKRNPLTAYIPILLLIRQKRLRHQLLKDEFPFDDYLLTPPDPVELKLRVELTLRRTEQNLHANPLTRLPGSLSIEKEIEGRIGREEIFSVCHFDIDRFKAFNDAYGYDRGNGVLSQMARILVEAIREVGEPSDFIGHIGGDDFVIVTHPSRQEALCLFSVREFDRLVPLHYPAKDRQQGYIFVKNRAGKEQRFPLMTLSIAVATNQSRRLHTSHQVSEVTSDIKRYLKARASSSHSLYLIDRRQDPEASPTHAKKEKKAPKSPVSLRGRTKPLGQILLEAKVITEQQLEEALRRHWRSAQRLGQVLIDMSLVQAEQLGGLLSRQLGIPYVKLEGLRTQEIPQGFPKDLIQEHEVFPLSRQENRFFIAMTNPLDQRIIEQVEKLVGCSVEPRLTTEADLRMVTHKP